MLKSSICTVQLCAFKDKFTYLEMKQGGSTMKKIRNLLNRRAGFFIIAVLSYWAKTYFAYALEFNLGVNGFFQHLILFINPLPTIVILVSLGLYFKDSKTSYTVMWLVQALATLLLFANILYYREFADFLTANVAVGAGSVTTGLFSATINIMTFWDILYWVDVIILGLFVFRHKWSEPNYDKPVYKRYALLTTMAGVVAFGLNLGLSEVDRPQLLERTFDRNYIVKYLGLNFFTGYDVANTFQNNQIRANADESDMSEVVEFVKDNHADPDPDMFGKAEGRNVITIVLESAQQFLVDYELEDAEGNKHEVTPFLNSLYHDEATYSFENFFHQVGQGKSSDAEVLVENSLFGLPQGSAFQTLGTSNTFQAAPSILKQKAGYTSASFHGNVGSFWNRTDTYQSFGYDYFFDSEFYELTDENSLEYGLKDKVFFHDSAKYIEQLPQPFYSKFLTVTNHFPYPLDEANIDFPQADTSDDTINQYFQTNHYADQAMEEFFDWLKESGLYEDSIILIYGDHYGISDMRNPVLGELLGVPEDEWDAYHNAQMQRVPLLFHIPGETDGQTFDQYVGQVDLLPTLLHLLGIETEEYIFMGQDMFSPDHNDAVTMRNGRFINEKYTIVGSSIYDTQTGDLLNDDLSDEEIEAIMEEREEYNQVLTHSDNIVMKDLLRFYMPESLKGRQPNDYIYYDQLELLENHPHRSTSVIGQNNGQSVADKYVTDAPEITGEPIISEFNQYGQELIENGQVPENFHEEDQVLEEDQTEE